MRHHFARPIAAADHWDLVDVIAIVSDEHKSVGSTGGHKLAHTSPYYAARMRVVQQMLPRVRQAILDRDLSKLGPLIEADALSLHFMAMTSNPSIVYWNQGTIALMHAIRAWREAEGATAIGYFTMDAGPNVHIIAERAAVAPLLDKLQSIPEVKDTLVCGAGPDAHLTDNHLF